MRSLNIITECCVDTNMVETLCSVLVNHQKCCSKVTCVMERMLNDGFAIGVIDDDKKKPTYVGQFHEIVRTGHLTFLKHDSKPHYLVLVKPATDKFILDVAKNAKVDVRSFGFSSKLKEFTNRTKTLSSDKDPDLKALFYALKEFGEFKVLSSVLMYLNNNKYNSTEAGVKCIVEEGRCKM